MRPATAPDHLQIQAYDGVRLAADHYRTETDREVLGTVLIRTPYGRTQYADQARAWVRSGYDVVVQDVRGRYGSDGGWHPYTHEGPDGAASVGFLASSGALRGPIILAGASYDAHCAVEAARVLEAPGPASDCAPLAVVAMVPALGLFETARHPDGAPRLRDRIGWWHQHGFGRTSREPLPAAELQRMSRQAEEVGMGRVLHCLIQDAVYGPGSGDKWRRLWESPPLDLRKLYGQLTTPLLVISGQRDFFVAEALELTQAWGSAMPGTLVETLWGPWGHGLAKDLDAGTAAALREQGGLMAPIKDFLRVAAGRDLASTRDLAGAGDIAAARRRAVTADGSRPAVIRWERGNQTGSWSWTPTTTDMLQHK